MACVAGFLISIPIATVAAVAGFSRGWRGAPLLLDGENIIDPFVHLGWALASAVFYALIAAAAVPFIAILAIAIHHLGPRPRHPPNPPTSNETDHIA